jgi:iron complex outermembrane receptor protein
MRLLLFLLALLAPLFVFTQQNRTGYGVIKGIVLTSDGQPAQYVSVTIKDTKEGTTTDESGNFEIKKVKANSHILAISLLGYFDSSMTVEVLNNETVFLKVQLQRTYAELKAVIIRASAYVETKASESLRLNLPLNETPQNIIVTPRQLLADQGLLTMTEALRTVAGVQRSGGGLNDVSLMMRGTDVGWWALYRNGAGSYWWNQQEDVAMIEKIEFVKGPANFMSGASNGAGLTNVVTKQPVKEQVASLNEGFGSFNLMRLTADFGGPLTKKRNLSYRFNAGIHNQERAFQYGRALRYFICPILKYDINSKTSIMAEYNYMWGRTAGNNDDLPSINGKMFALPRDFAAADDKSDRLIVADNFYHLNLKHDFNNNWHLNVQLTYANGKWGGDHLMSTEWDLPVSNDTLYRFASYDEWRNFSKLSQAFIDGKFYTGKKIEHRVLFGPSYGNWGVTDTSGDTWGEKKLGLYIPSPDYYIHPDSLKNYPNASSSRFGLKEAAFYAQDNIKIAGKLIITLAGRFTHARLSLLGYGLPKDQEETLFDVFTPRAGLTWLFGDAVSVYTLYDQYFNSQFGRSFDNKPFKPMTGYNLETGMKGFFFNGKLGLNSSAFYTVRNNLRTSDPQHAGYDIQKGQVVSKGIDFDLTGNLSSAIVVNANYEYVDAKVTKDTDPLNVGLKNFGTPSHSANLWLKYNLVKGKLKGMSFAAGYQFMGKRVAVDYYIPDPAFLPPHNLFDASIGYVNERFTLNLNVYNLTDIKYADRGYYTPLDEWRYTPGEPVNFRLSVGINLLKNKNKLSNKS